MNRLSLQGRAKILSCLVEGNSMRATTRMCGVSINTVAKLLSDLGTACAIYQNEVFRNLKVNRVQVDEIWSFCYSKQKNTPRDQRALGRGDVYTWVAIDAETKLVPSWLVGKRDADYAQVFISDLASRIDGRTQLTSDGLKSYLEVVEPTFGANVDFGMLKKLYGPAEGNQQEKRYSVVASAAVLWLARFVAILTRSISPPVSWSART
jgi:lambda repressor-like predicted transcriptional regulator